MLMSPAGIRSEKDCARDAQQSFPNSIRLRVHNKVIQKTIMEMKMYAILDKAKPHTENIKGLNLAAVIYTTGQVSRLLR
jgi:hypothetical protein